TDAASSFRSAASNSPIVGKTGSLNLAAASAARAASGSTAPTSVTPSPADSSSRYTRRWLRPKAPAPATATRKGDWLAILLPLFAFHGPQAAAVELKQVGHVFVRLRC